MMNDSVDPYKSAVSRRLAWSQATIMHNGHPSAFCNERERIAAYAQICCEIEKLEAQIRDWKKRHNALSLSSRLPAEILSYIFQCVAQAERGEERMRRLKWIRVTHVCTHWRHIALESPRLWTDVPFVNTKWAPEMLRRAKRALLTVEAEVGLEKFGHIKDVLAYLPRAQRLSLFDGTPSNDRTAFHVALSKLRNAPFLEICKVHGDLHPENSPNTLPVEFLIDAPKLRSLSLKFYGLSWTSSLLNSSLTTLELSETPREAQPSMAQLIYALERTRNLEVLVLSSALRNDGDDALPPSHSAHLPHLRSLQVDASSTRCRELLRNIVYPMDTAIKLCPFPWPGYSDGFSDLRDLGQFLAGRMHPISFLEVNNRMLSFFEIRAWNDTPSGGVQSCMRPPGEVPRIDIHLKTSGHRLLVINDRVLAMAAFWNALPLQILKALYVNGLDMTASHWVNNFGSLERLESLNVVRYGSGLVEALSVDAKFDALQTLVARKWKFEGRNIGAVDANHLVACFHGRKERGVGLQGFYLYGSSQVSNGKVEAMNEAVRRMEWDGFEGFSDSEAEETEGSESEDTSSEDSNDDDEYEEDD
ncbi:hypothetical protein FPV67DRAFT_1197081 [Lyophyllum atratum]|nr:hypothetical protein FPV67DRAFT_1197081 [Lyophyllum atratum]